MRKARICRYLYFIILLSISSAEIKAGTPTIETRNGHQTLSRAGSHGDPHVRTLDGLAVTYIGCGDQLMLADSSDSIVFQARHCIRGNDASSTCAVALKCREGADVLELYSTGTNVRLFIGGSELFLQLSDVFIGRGVKVVRNNFAYLVNCESGFELSAHVRESSSGVNYLDTFVAVPSILRSNTRGLLGFWDDNRENDLAYPDGTIWSPGHGLDYVNGLVHHELDDIQNAWNVNADSLFQLSAADSNAECPAKSAQLRRAALSVKDLSGSLHAAGQALCSSMGLDGSWHASCVFDFVASDGDATFTEGSLHAYHVLR